MAKSKNFKQGAANSFDRKYLEANMVGEIYRGSIVTAVTNKYIHTEKESIIKKGHTVLFEHKQGTERFITPDTTKD